MAFPTGGYAMLRSGWGDGGRSYGDECWGVFDTGPLGDGGHGHYDHLAVELWAAGRPLALDAGRFTYADGPDGWRRWFKGTAAHNTVQVDGLDQTSYRPGKPKGPTSTAALVHCGRGSITRRRHRRRHESPLRRPALADARARRPRPLAGAGPPDGALDPPLRGPLAPRSRSPRST